MSNIVVGKFYKDDLDVYLVIHSHEARDVVIASVLHSFDGTHKDDVIHEYSYELCVEYKPVEITVEEAKEYV